MPHGTLLCEKLPTSSSHFRIGNRLERKPLLEILLCFVHARHRLGMLSNPAVALLPPGSKVCLNVVLVDDDAEIRRHYAASAYRSLPSSLIRLVREQSEALRANTRRARCARR